MSSFPFQLGSFVSERVGVGSCERTSILKKGEGPKAGEGSKRGGRSRVVFYCDCLAVSCFDDGARPCYIIAGCGHCGPLNLGIAWPNDLPTWAAWVAWVTMAGYGRYQANQERVLRCGCSPPPLSARHRCCVVGAAQVLQAAGTLRRLSDPARRVANLRLSAPLIPPV